MTDMTVEQIMVKKVRTLDSKDNLSLAEDVMTFDRIRHLPVVETGQVVGVVSQRDLFRASLAIALGYGEKAREALLRSIRVKEVMRPPIVVRPETSVKEAARLMLDQKIGCLPVVDSCVLVGIVTETDLLRQAWVDDAIGTRRVVRVEARFREQEPEPSCQPAADHG